MASPESKRQRRHNPLPVLISTAIIWRLLNFKDFPPIYVAPFTASRRAIRLGRNGLQTCQNIAFSCHNTISDSISTETERCPLRYAYCRMLFVLAVVMQMANDSLYKRRLDSPVTSPAALHYRHNRRRLFKPKEKCASAKVLTGNGRRVWRQWCGGGANATRQFASGPDAHLSVHCCPASRRDAISAIVGRRKMAIESTAVVWLHGHLSPPSVRHMMHVFHLPDAQWLDLNLIFPPECYHTRKSYVHPHSDGPFFFFAPSLISMSFAWVPGYQLKARARFEFAIRFCN